MPDLDPKAIILSGSDLIPDAADSTIIRGGWCITDTGDRVTFRTCDDRDYGIDAWTARRLGAALVQHSVRAEGAAEAEKLARLLWSLQAELQPVNLTGYEMAGFLSAARAVLAAGYRKAES